MLSPRKPMVELTSTGESPMQRIRRPNFFKQYFSHTHAYPTIYTIAKLYVLMLPTIQWHSPLQPISPSTHSTKSPWISHSTRHIIAPFGFKSRPTFQSTTRPKVGFTPVHASFSTSSDSQIFFSHILAYSVPSFSLKLETMYLAAWCPPNKLDI